MARDKRYALIQKIEEHRHSRVITYVTGDRQPIGGQIGDDAVRPFYGLLRQIPRGETIDLFLYTRGGTTDVPWRLVRQLRSRGTEWNVLVPFRANSAGTLVALGADQIVFGSEGELGPIDPTMSVRRVMPGPGGQGTPLQDNISVEDVMAYVRFVQEKVGLSEQAAVAGALSKLSDRVDPVALGSVHRTHSHIRDVARQILSSRKEPPSDAIANGIVETLAEKVYAHGHAIGVEAAEEMGLPAQQAGEELEHLMWELLSEYEVDLQTQSPIDPAYHLRSADFYTENAVIAAMDINSASFEFEGSVEVRAKRALPQQLNVSLNCPIQFPANMPKQAQQALQAILQQAQQILLQQAQQAVQQALAAQAQLLGADISFRNGKWVRKP